MRPFLYGGSSSPLFVSLALCWKFILASQLHLLESRGASGENTNLGLELCGSCSYLNS